MPPRGGKSLLAARSRSGTVPHSRCWGMPAHAKGLEHQRHGSNTSHKRSGTVEDTSRKPAALHALQYVAVLDS